MPVTLKSIRLLCSSETQIRKPRSSACSVTSTHQYGPESILDRGSLSDIEGWVNDLPIVGVSASDAIAYGRWLGEQLGNASVSHPRRNGKGSKSSEVACFPGVINGAQNLAAARKLAV